MTAGQPARLRICAERDGQFVHGLEPLAGKRHVHVTAQRTCQDFARVILDLVDVLHPDAEKIDLVMDNLKAHTPASLYRAFLPAEAKRLADRLEVHYTARLVAEHGRDRVVRLRQALGDQENRKGKWRLGKVGATRVPPRLTGGSRRKSIKCSTPLSYQVRLLGAAANV